MSTDTWQSLPTDAFVLHYRTDTAAEKSLMLVRARLATVREATVRLLALPDAHQAPIHVYLLDSADDEMPAVEPPAGSAVEAVALRIASVYHDDSPGETLERDLVAVLLAPSVPFVIDGVLGFVTQQTAGTHRAPGGQALHDRVRQGQPVGLAALIGGPRLSGDPVYFQAATAFVGFLIATYGAERVRSFARALETADPDSAVQRAFGKPLAVVEKHWIGTLGTGQQQLLGVGGLLHAMAILVRPHRALVILVLLAFVPIIAFRALSPLIFKGIIDGGLLGRNTRLLIGLITALFVLLVAKSAGLFAREYLVARVSALSINDLRLSLLGHLQRLSHDFYARSQVGDLVSRVSSDLDIIENALSQAVPVSVLMGAVCIVSAALLFTQDWRLSLLVVIMLPLLYVDFRIVAPRAEHASFERQQNAAHVVSTVEEYVLARPVAVAFGLNSRILDRFRAELATLTASTVRVGFLSGMLSLSAVGGGALLSALVISIGAFMVLHGHLTVGGLVAFYGLAAQVVAPIEWIAVQIQPMTKAVGAFQRLEELLGERPQIADAPDARPLPVLAREIHFEDVTFSYTGARVDVPRLTLTIPAGQSVALVGPSGCGKSTVLSMLMRFYDPTLGSVRFDGHDLRLATQASLRAQTGIVFQESILFNTTIRENIRLGRLDATDAEIEAAARAAEIHDFIATLPQGYETMVGERGGRLSGGQRQRLAIARAIVRNPPLLLLDEATSALDSEAEAQINATLKRVAKGRTVVSVTHRLAVAADADRIVVLQAGRVVEDGHHEALLQQRGLYYRMWQQQHGLEAEGREGPPALETLRSVPMFRDLDEDMLNSLVAQLRTEEFAAGDLIYAEGDTADRLYVITRGAVEVTSLGPTGTEELLAVLTEGDHFGEMALRRDLPRTTTVRARADSAFLTLERRAIVKSMGDVVELPVAERRIVVWALRRQDVSPAEVAAATGQDEASARQLLDGLVTKGYLQEVSRNGETRYRARLARRRESRLAGKIWEALGDR